MSVTERHNVCQDRATMVTAYASRTVAPIAAVELPTGTVLRADLLSGTCCFTTVPCHATSQHKYGSGKTLCGIRFSPSFMLPFALVLLTVFTAVAQAGKRDLP